MGKLIVNSASDLIDGCYHELGHIIASMLCLPDYDVAGGISISRNEYGYLGLDVPTELVDFPLQREIRNFALYTICGGVFQQMKNYYKDWEVSDVPDKDDNALLLYLSKEVKSYIPEMEGDYKSLKKYEKALTDRGIALGYDYEQIKDEAIKILFPYIGDGGIDVICSTCAKMLYKHISENKPLPFTLEMELIEPLLSQRLH